MIDLLKKEVRIRLAMPNGHGEETKEDEEDDDNSINP